jgi:serine/threonine-protein kinase HipA
VIVADVEVYIDFSGGLRRVGTLHRQPRRGGEAISFEYHREWLGDAARFSLEPALTLGQGAFAPAAGLTMFGSIGDSAPDTWGRRLMQRAERRQAQREGRPARSCSSQRCCWSSVGPHPRCRRVPRIDRR